MNHRKSRDVGHDTNPGDSSALRVRCPECGSKDVSVIPRRESLRSDFSIRALRRCEDCGALFAPRSGIVISILATVLGITFLLGCIRFFIVAPVSGFAEKGFSLGFLMTLGVGVLSFLPLCGFVYAGIKGVSAVWSKR